MLHVKYHWFTAASVVPSPPDILYKQPVDISYRFIPSYYHCHAFSSGCFTNTKLSTTEPDQLAEVECLVTKAWTVEVIAQDFFVPEFGDLGSKRYEVQSDY